MSKHRKLSPGQVVQAMTDRPWSLGVHVTLWAALIVAFVLGFVAGL